MRAAGAATTAWICVGGGIGAVARFAIGGWVTTWAQAGFPWATLLINLTGSILLGVVQTAASAVSDRMRGFLAIGVCGGFTTFSTFSYETIALFDRGQFALGAVYATASGLLCVAGLLAGASLARRARRPAGAPG